MKKTHILSLVALIALSCSPIQAYSIFGTVWNGNATADCGHDTQPLPGSGIAGIEITLCDGDGNPILIDGAPYTVLTDENGDYGFSPLAPFVADANFVFTVKLGDVAGLELENINCLNTFKDLDPTDGCVDTGALNPDKTIIQSIDLLAGTATIDMIAAQNVNFCNTAVTDIDFVLCSVPTGKIGDKVWIDHDGDGIFDEDTENGVGDVKLELLDATGAVIATTLTTESGMYLFDKLSAGDYTVRIAADSAAPGSAFIPCGELGESKASPAAVNLPADDSCDLTIDFCFYPEPPPVGGEGCTPGYWRQAHHYGNWIDFDPSDTFESVFGVVVVSSDLTLGEAVRLRGGKIYALSRHAVAAILNAASPDVDYDLAVAEVIDLVNAAITAGDKKGITRLKNMLVDLNEQGCPLGRAE